MALQPARMRRENGIDLADGAVELAIGQAGGGAAEQTGLMKGIERERAVEQCCRRPPRL